ncbi:MAG: glutamate synthase large subunit [Elusimicrobiota bacterium]
MSNSERTQNHGLYDPRYEHDSCGVGFVCDIKGRRSNDIVLQGLEVLRRLSHRGATGSDPKTGDGAGILIQIPHEFLSKAVQPAGFNLPGPGEYAAGLVFLPKDPAGREFCKKTFTDTAKQNKLELLGWRNVPVDSSVIGKTARDTEPAMEQVFIQRPQKIKDQADFERKLYVLRKQAETAVRSSGNEHRSSFYITNLSSRTLLYKGLLMPEQLENYFVDLKDKDISSAICLVHSRYSTNTFPTWDLAQPFRYLAHNGEINTLRGNANWMRAKEGMMQSRLYGRDIEKLKPVVVPGGSDSAALDNVFELLVAAGRPLAQAMTMLIPAAWEHDDHMSPALRDYYMYHTCIMEPWDGPAAVAFSDGTCVGAVLDRNGLRPARYIVTKDGRVVMASEVGVLDIDPADIVRSGRLEPGRIFYVDTAQGIIIPDEDIKKTLASKKPYGEWIRENMIELDDLREVPVRDSRSADIDTSLKAFGYTREDLKVIIKPMAEFGQEPVGSMGNDAPHAVLSQRPQLPYNYFRQLFAQVTNPPIDPIREELVMSLESYMGSRNNLMDEKYDHAVRLRIMRPILTNSELEKIRAMKEPGFKVTTISTLFKAGEEGAFMGAIDRICDEADLAVKERDNIIILSDRGADRENAAVPALLAVGAVHHFLVRKATRAQVGLIVESAEPREVTHFALLLGFGAGCVNPYLAYEAVEMLARQGELNLNAGTALNNYVHAVEKGIKKILSKMGISTLQSYRGAQIFEALGLGNEVIERCFAGTVSRVGGAGFDVLEKECLARHAEAFSERKSGQAVLESGGVYQWKRDGEFHLWNPESIAALQDAVRNNDAEKYRKFAGLINDQSKQPVTLRSLLRFRNLNSVPLSEVEPAGDILKRFATGAMSFGSISRATHETIAVAMNRIGGKSNTGEGGEDPARFVPLPNGDSKRSAIKQVASGRFGVTANYLINAEEIQIKIAQGAKPGEGGQLPGHKVSAVIARTRYTTQGVTLISPPPHHDIYSIEDLAQLIFDLKNVNPRARISVKLVSEIGVGTVAAGVAKGHADMILISGGDGGTGASPVSSIKHAGLPWELGLAETHQTLVMNDLRSRVRLQADGQMRTGRDVAIAALLGAEEFGFCTAVLVTLGCVMLRHCNLNNCSVGVATQDEELEKRFAGKPEYIINYFNFVVEELRGIMAQLGVRKLDDMIGRTELLEVNEDIKPWKAKDLDYSRILYKPESPPAVGTRCTTGQNHGIEDVLDRKLMELAKEALQNKKPVRIEMPIKNFNRTAGAMLSGEVCRRFGEEGLPDDTIHCKFTGNAGQSFAAWLGSGVTFELEGMANDYVGKGISGGKIIIYPGKGASYVPEENIIIGNTTFYGAISGEAYIRGVAGERFCIRNSGLNAVVEGVGDHGCEYMTGGRVVVLGRTGRNFAAGMSGGMAYVYDPAGNLKLRCNLGMAELDTPGIPDKEAIKILLRNHLKYTGSAAAKKILDNFDVEILKFTRVISTEYKSLLNNRRIEPKFEVEEDPE